MSKSDKTLELLRQLGDRGAWLTELEQESDRGAALLACAFLDAMLGQVLERCFISPEKGRQLFARASFGARLQWAVALGAISDVALHDLEVLQRVRNKFAHRLHGLTFESAEVREETRNLNVPDEFMAEADTSRGRYIFSAVLLARYLGVRQKYFIAPVAPIGWASGRASLEDPAPKTG